MKIALVTRILDFGGVEIFLDTLASEFLRLGNEVSIVVTQKRGTWYENFKCKGFQIIDCFEHGWSTPSRHVRQLADILSAYDCVVVNHSRAGQASLGLLPSSVVTVSILHNDVQEVYELGVSNWENLDQIVAVSEGIRAKALSYLPESYEKIRTITHGVEVPETYPKKDVLPDGILKISYLGRLCHEQKGVLYLPEILAGLTARGLRFFIDIVGDGPDADALREQLEATLNRDCYRMHGRLEQSAAHKMMKESDVLLMPSHFEGHGLGGDSHCIEASAYH